MGINTQRRHRVRTEGRFSPGVQGSFAVAARDLNLDCVPIHSVSVLERPFLIVDDSAVVRSVVKDQLERLGVKEVVLAKSADEAVAQYEAHRPGVVLLDITMPEVPGTRVAHHILKSDPHAKVVLVTAMSRDKDLVESAIAGGAYAYLRKPVADMDLKALLERIHSEEKQGPDPFAESWGPTTARG